MALCSPEHLSSPVFPKAMDTLMVRDTFRMMIYKSVTQGPLKGPVLLFCSCNGTSSVLVTVEGLGLDEPQRKTMDGLQAIPLSGVVLTGPHHPFSGSHWPSQLCFSCLEALLTQASVQKNTIFPVPSQCLPRMHFLSEEKCTDPFCVRGFHENDSKSVQ